MLSAPDPFLVILLLAAAAAGYAWFAWQGRKLDHSQAETESDKPRAG